MARRRTASGSTYAFFNGPIMGACLWGGAALVLAMMLVTFNQYDPSWFYYATDHLFYKNALGSLGANVSAALFFMLGWAAYGLVALLFGIAYCIFKRRSIEEEFERIAAGVVLIIVSAMLLYSFRLGSISTMVPGGTIGQDLYRSLLIYLDPVAAIAVLSLLTLAALLIITRTSLFVLLRGVVRLLQIVFKNWRVWALPCIRLVKRALKTVRAAVVWVYKGLVSYFFVAPEPSTLFSLEPAEQAPQDYIMSASMGMGMQGQREYHAAAIQVHGSQASAIAKAQLRARNYSIPPATLFDPSHKERVDQRTDLHKQLAKLLEEKLLRFGISGNVTNIKPGPVITLFEYQPDIDAKVSRILGLEHDLALALEALSVRIIAPIPGTSLVGFEVANKERQAVHLRDSIRSAAFQKSTALLPVVLGKDTAGDEVVVDLADMPHLLVAGSTGSGKSVALNTLLISLLCKRKPDELKLIIIDPKRLEFAAYHDIAHLLFPIITHPHKAAPVLRWLVREMEERYETMAQLGTRSIADYKKLCKTHGAQDKLPLIVLMIDELADLMMVARKDVEENIARLAQMARAAGIHLIVATQRPSVDVLTGLIKVNFTSRISFRVTSKVDSRTILDALGAETLLGKGDMLFMDAHSARMRRIHGAYVTDAEIGRVVNHIKAQQKVQYASLEEAVAAYQEDMQQLDEPLLHEIIEYLGTVQEISISLLQRRFKIGYNRSARVIELLEAQGKIAPADGAKMRKVIR